MKSTYPLLLPLVLAWCHGFAVPDNAAPDNDFPSLMPSDSPSSRPSDFPSMVPSDLPSMIPSDLPSDIPSSAPSVDITSLPPINFELETCFLNMAISDANRDGVLSVSEYVRFLERFRGTEYSCIDLEEASFEILTIYNIIVSLCQEFEGSEPDCVLGADRGINLDGIVMDGPIGPISQDNEQLVYLYFACFLSDSFVQETCTSNTPVEPISIVPSDAPSLAPSGSGAPSGLEPTETPSIEPTVDLFSSLPPFSFDPLACFETLSESDVSPKDGVVSLVEYAFVVRSEADAQCPGSYDLSELSFTITLIYSLIVSICTELAGAEPNCAFNDNAGIITAGANDPLRTQEQFGYLLVVCALTDSIVQDICPTSEPISDFPSDTPSFLPSDLPSSLPSDLPSSVPTDLLAFIPSDMPSLAPSDVPSLVPSDTPSSIPSDLPSLAPSDTPSLVPSDTPSSIPSDLPSTTPSAQPSLQQGDGRRLSWPVTGNGISLEIIFAADEGYKPTFTEVVSNWDNGMPDGLSLNTSEASLDSSCQPVAGKMKVCSGDYGETEWKSVSSILISSGSIVSGTVRMNDYYLTGDLTEDKYYMCRQIGSSLGLQDLNDEANCMNHAPTGPLEDHTLPSQTSFDYLADLYGGVSGRQPSFDPSSKRNLRSGADRVIENQAFIPHEVKTKFHLLNRHLSAVPWHRALGHSHEMALGDGWSVQFRFHR